MFFSVVAVKVCQVDVPEPSAISSSRRTALVGSIEEVGQSSRAASLVRDQFETNFYSVVNIIKAVLPDMRERKNGHIIVLTGISMSCQIHALKSIVDRDKPHTWELQV